MIDPIRMVFVNLLTSGLVLGGILFYIYIYPKKKVNLFVVLLFVSILPLMSLLRPGDYESGDFNIHLYRIMTFYDSLKEGLFMPSWASELNATYGNPLFLFNYSLPYYFVSLFHFIGFTFIDSMKIFLGINLFLSGIFMYMWIKKVTDNQLAAFTASLFYIFNPYHLIDIHFRATLGESTIFTLAPLLFYLVTKYCLEKKNIYLILTAIITGLTFLAHPLLAGVILGIAFLYIFLLTLPKKSYKTLFLTCLALLLGVISAMYMVIPFFLYSHYTYPSPNPEAGAPFSPFQNLFFSPWRYGFLFQGPKGELALIIGYTQLLVVLLSTILLLRGKIQKKIRSFYIFWICIFYILLFLISPLSETVWNPFKILWMLLITGRLLLPIALVTSVIAAYLIISFSKSKKQRLLVYILLFITVSSTMLNWGHRRVIPEIDDNALRAGVWKSTLVESTTAYFLNNKWADINNFWFAELPKQHLEIINGRATFQEIKRTSIKHTYVVNAETPITVKENTLYFPGWTLTSNDKQVTIYPGKRGVIHAKLPKGIQYLELTYEDLQPLKLAKITSIAIFSVLLLLLIILGLFGRFFKFRKH